MTTEPNKPVEVFYSYAHEDKKLRDELKTQLSNLKRQGVITDWFDRDISAGNEWNDEIEQHLNSARVILLLISPDFMSSGYWNNAEVTRALERHEAGEARVIPVILRPVDWGGGPFSKLQALPSNAKPISLWNSSDEAFLDVARGIRKAARQFTQESSPERTGAIPSSLAVGFVARRDRDGRDMLSRLKEELSPPKHQIVALWGAGGVGKTTLASEAARSLAETFVQHIIWIGADAYATRTFSGLLDAIASQMGRPDLRPLSVELKEEHISRLLTSEPTLIVLDNFETISPKEQRLLLEFLDHHTRSSTLITTRERIDSTYLMPLASMSRDEAEEYLNRLIAQTYKPEVFETVDHEDILRTAEFNPLIIRWIVAQIDLAESPDEVLSDLAHGEGDAALRVFDRSFNLPQLEEGGRALLLALSLFVPSATRPTVAEVAGMGKEKDRKRFKKAQQTLASLWLVKEIDAGQRLMIEGVTRQLARAHLTKDPRANSFRRRYVDRFLRYAEVHSTTTAQDLDLIEVEKDNILNAGDLAFELRSWSSVIDIYSALEKFLEIRGYWDELLRRGEQAIEAARAVKDSLAIARFSGNSATILMRRGEHATAREIYEQALADFKKSGSSRGIAATLHQLGVLAQGVGNLSEARSLYGESLSINKTLGAKSSIASTLHQLGMLAQDQGNYSEARRLYDESLEIKRDLSDHGGIASTLHQLGVLAQNRGEFFEASRLYDESLEIKRRLGDQSSIASILHNFGMIAQSRGELSEAERLYQESLQIEVGLGNQSGIATTLFQLGMIARDRQDFGEAERLHKEGLEINRKLGDQRSIALNLWQLGRLAHDRHDDADALSYLTRAYLTFYDLHYPQARDTLEDIINIFQTVGPDKFKSDIESLTNRDTAQDIFDRVTLESNHRRAERLMYEGRWREAREILEKNKVGYKARLDRLGFAKTLLALAQAEQKIGDLERARWTYKDALDQFGGLDEKHIALTSVYLGRLELQTGLVADALKHLEDAEQYFQRVDGVENLKRVRKLLDAAKEMTSSQSDDETWAGALLDNRKIEPQT